jgi:hypothetical protein
MTGDEARRATKRLARIWPSEASYGASLRRIELIFPVEGALDSSTSQDIRENSLRKDEETQARQATTNTIAMPNTQAKDQTLGGLSTRASATQRRNYSELLGRQRTHRVVRVPRHQKPCGREGAPPQLSRCEQKV